MMKKIFFTGALLLPFIGFVHSQTFINPNYSLKSHETLNIIKVEVKPEATFIYLSIGNRIERGTFCADKKIFIIFPDGEKSKLVSSSGIPVCPDTYKFKAIGEKLEFVLAFPRLMEKTEWIDLIEDCSENCFSFYGITLNSTLNIMIDDAFALVENKEQAKALDSFINIADVIDEKNYGIEGLLYINIIKLARESGDEIKAESWYKRLILSGAPRFMTYIKFLNDQGIKY
jgi:hypothetical protein